MQAHLKKKVGSSAIRMDRIVSPVAQYIKQHPVPPLIRQVKPGKNRHHDDEVVAAVCAAAAVDDVAHHDDERDGNHRFAALPEAVYRSSRVAVEKEMRGKKAATLPKSFGKQDNVEAMVCVACVTY